MHLLTAGRYDAARALANKAWSLIAAGGAIDAAVAARLNAMRALQASFDGDLALYRSSTEAAIRDYSAVGDVRAACLQRVNLGDALRKLRAYEAAAPVLSDALMDARSMGLDYLAALASFHLAEVRSHGGDLDGARRLLDEAVAAFTSLGDRRWEGAARVQRALLYAERGALVEAEAEARAAVEILAVAPPLCAQALAALAKVALLRGQVEEGTQAARQAIELLEKLGKIEEGEAFVRSVYAQALAATTAAG